MKNCLAERGVSKETDKVDVNPVCSGAGDHMSPLNIFQRDKFLELCDTSDLIRKWLDLSYANK